MLQLHRIYTPEELRAMARPAPAGSRHPKPGRPNRDNGRGSVLATLARLVRRSAVRRPAPGTT